MRNAAKLSGDGIGGGAGVWGVGAGRPRRDVQRRPARGAAAVQPVLRGVPHVVQQRTRQYGPVLSRETLGGDEELMREYIGNGTPRMPGFRFYFEPEQIDAIVAYLKTVPPQPAPAAGR